MKYYRWICVVCVSVAVSVHAAEKEWVVDSAEDWQAATQSSEGLEIKDGSAAPTDKQGRFTSVIKRFDSKRSAASLVFRQTPEWLNWIPRDNLGPDNLSDAPVLLVMGPDNYWMFGKKGGKRRGGKSVPKGDAGFKAEDVTVEGFDIPLKTTPYKNQYDAPGGLQPGLGGYHAWQSRDMETWVHHGPVTEGFSRWVTTAEQVDGKVYIYYDFPNDQDPHLYIDADLTDGKPGTNMGIAFADPSHGSDTAVIRDLDGNFHVIYEDWTPINARKHSWDSPLGGRAVSKDGKGDFVIKDPAVDQRTKPTGKMATYLHPHWVKEDPKRFSTNVAEYEIHEPEQNAFGDWAAIAVGGQYYLFADYHPAHDKIRVGWFTSSSIDKPFTFCGEIGRGHPDPDICFAEGQFYLATQMQTDYTSPGPWVQTVEARAGVDRDNDGSIDVWTDWQEVKEHYDYIEGFSKQVSRTPASLDLSGLPDGFGFRFEFRVDDTTDNASRPDIDSIHLMFK